MNNMQYYSAARSVPPGALKPIKGGAYGAAGLSDINPQWRIERMTELFGPCGIGWDFTPEIWTDNGVCYAHVTVTYRCNDGWSKPVHGYGGTKIGNKDDSDLIKSTVTDALGNAMRYIGIGADVWYNPGNTSEQNQFDTKFSAPPPAPDPKPQRQMATKQQIQYISEQADDELYMQSMNAFGENLERMTYKQAEKIIDRIKGGAA